MWKKADNIRVKSMAIYVTLITGKDHRQGAVGADGAAGAALYQFVSKYNIQSSKTLTLLWYFGGDVIPATVDCHGICCACWEYWFMWRVWLQTCSRVPWMWLCWMLGPDSGGSSCNKVQTVQGTWVTSTNGTRARAAISLVRYTAERLHLPTKQTDIDIC